MPTFDDYLSDVVPLFGGFISILGVSEIATRVIAACYGVKLSPSFLVPSSWKGCLGVMNNYESLLPNKKALFDIPVARTASAYLTSLVLAVATFVADGSFNGGNNALYIRPQFFYNNPLLAFIQFIIGPYTDDLGNILPYAVEGVGVPFRKGGHFIEPVTLRKTRGRSHCSSNVWEENCHIVIIRHITFARHWWSEWKCALFAWGLFATFFHGGEEYRRKTRSPLWGTTGMLGVLPLASSLFPLMEEGHSTAHYRRGI